MLIPYKQVAIQTELQNCQKSAADFLCSLEAAQVLILVESFSLTSFYANQKVIINAMLEKQDSIVIQSTGNEKSLLLSVSTSLSAKKAIVIMPAISLMRDQTMQVNEQGIKVT